MKYAKVPYGWFGSYGATHGDELFYTFGFESISQYDMMPYYIKYFVFLGRRMN